MKYPLYLIPIAGGFASIVDPETAGSPADSRTHLLVVHGHLEQAEAFMERCGLVGNPRAINNDREFLWLLNSLKHPVTEVAFDPSTNIEHGLQCRWRVGVTVLMEEHLEADFSPWNYPVFAIRQEGGYASIAGSRANNQVSTAVALFTSRERAENYLGEAEEEGAVQSVEDVEEARELLNDVRDQASAVALNPEVAETGRRAKHCFEIATLMDKYLKSVV